MSLKTTYNYFMNHNLFTPLLQNEDFCVVIFIRFIF